MKSINVGVLKSNFSNVIQSVQNEGETYIVEYGKKHNKVAMIIPYDPKLEQKAQRRFGLLQGKGGFKIGDDFEMSDEELLGI